MMILKNILIGLCVGTLILADVLGHTARAADSTVRRIASPQRSSRRPRTPRRRSSPGRFGVARTTARSRALLTLSPKPPMATKVTIDKATLATKTNVCLGELDIWR